MLFGKHKYHLPFTQADGNDRFCGNPHISAWPQTRPLKVSDETVRQAVLKLGYVYKKKSLHASEQERPRHSIEAKKLAATYSGERRKAPCVSR